MVEIAYSHGGDNSYIYKDNWNMQEEVQFVILAIHEWQINKLHLKGGNAWMQIRKIHWSIVASSRYHNEMCHHIYQWHGIAPSWK